MADRFQPATRELMVFTKSARRFFDVDAVRTPYAPLSLKKHGGIGTVVGGAGNINGPKDGHKGRMEKGLLTHPGGAPPLDWWKVDPDNPPTIPGGDMPATFYIGDAIETMNKLPAGSVDLILTSPPFLALRSYLPGDHPDKGKEGGSQSTPGEFIDWLIDFAEASARVLAPHGSFCVELGDTYSGSGGGGGDYYEGGLREGQPGFTGSGAASREALKDANAAHWRQKNQNVAAWPLAKSLSLIPELFRLSLVYGFNPLTGRQTERWRLRNVVRWVRPNPPVGALGDKFRPATSELMVFCKSAKRYFDLDAVRTEHKYGDYAPGKGEKLGSPSRGNGGDRNSPAGKIMQPNPAGAPPLDWWEIPPGGYSGTAMWTAKLPVDPRESSGDIWRTTSADCPVHGDLPDPEPTAPHDEPGSGDRPARNPGTDSRPVPTPPPGSVPTHQQTLLNLEDETSGWLPPGSIHAATPHSKASNRTDPVPATKSPDTASGRTRRRIDDISAGPLSDGPRPDTPENRTSAEPLDVPDPENPARTGRNPLEPEACTCPDSSHYAVFPEEVPLDWWEIPPGGFTGSHYAVFPLELCVRPVKAMCPERVCKVCGEPSRRISEVEFIPLDDGQPKVDQAYVKGLAASRGDGYMVAQGMRLGRAERRSTTTGWTDCGHDDWRPGLILDPFGGSGTVAAVATGHGRDCILIDLDERNFDLALGRVGPFMLTLGNIDQ